MRDCSYTQNRELSWLKFNLRVLEEAADETVPLLERLNYIAIFCSNLDEFFMVRVGNLFDISMISPNETDNKTGMTAREQLRRIYQEIPGLMERKKEIYRAVCGGLAEAGVEDVPYEDLKAEELRYVSEYFQTKALPVLSPIVIGSHHPAPHLPNKELYVAALLRSRKGKAAVGLLPVPKALPALLMLPGSDGRFIRMEQVILRWTPALFGKYQVEQRCVLCVTRNADLSFEQDNYMDGDFRDRVVALLRQRTRLGVLRLEMDREISEEFLSLLQGITEVGNPQVYVDAVPLNMKYVRELVSALPGKLAAPLRFAPYRPRWPEDLRREESVLDQIRRKDRLLFFPYDSVEPFLRLLSEAAERPDVLSIKITIYRLASSSKIAHTLCRAAENGKEVTVLMELRARFDEANNVSWSKLLEDAGCQVIYGVADYKCHSKLCLITLRNRGRLQYITQIGTGNYNEKTNAMYTDLSLMTASDEIGADGAAFFRDLLTNNLDGNYQKLLASPSCLKAALMRRIDEEMEKGERGYICIKANAITERDVIDKLREASGAGVEIRLLIRGICCILPGIPGKTDHISVKSIVGRYLEHGRIYCFGRGGEAKLYIASADLMTRNLVRRVELAVPVEDPEIRAQLLSILDTQFEDQKKAYTMAPDGTYHRTVGPVNSQEIFMEASLHRPAAEAPGKTGRPAAALRSLLGRILKRNR